MRDLILVAVLVAASLAGAAPTYFAQTPPGTRPELFAPGLVSTGQHELSICFTPDGRSLYLTVTGPVYWPRFMLHSHDEGDRWSDLREVDFFCAPRRDSYPFVAPDGRDPEPSRQWAPGHLLDSSHGSGGASIEQRAHPKVRPPVCMQG